MTDMNTPAGGDGRERPRCGAIKRDGSGEPCGLPAGHGTNHVGWGRCRRHGGNTQSQQVAVQRLQAERACREFGIAVPTTPHAALKLELMSSYGQVLFYRERVRELMQREDGSTDYSRLVYGSTRASRTTKTGREALGAVSTAEQTQQAESRPHVWITLLQEAERHHLRVAATCVQLGIQEQAVELLQAEAANLMRVVNLTLAKLGVDPGDPRVHTVLGEVVREVAGR